MYPIEDILLTIYDALFHTKSAPLLPIGFRTFEFIPGHRLGEILIVWNFFRTYQESLGSPNFSKDQLYLALVKLYCSFLCAELQRGCPAQLLEPATHVAAALPSPRRLPLG